MPFRYLLFPYFLYSEFKAYWRTGGSGRKENCEETNDFSCWMENWPNLCRFPFTTATRRKINSRHSILFMSYCADHLTLTSADRRTVGRPLKLSPRPKFSHCLTNKWRRGRNCEDQFPAQSSSWWDAWPSCRSLQRTRSWRLGTGWGRRRSRSSQQSHWLCHL